MEQFIDVVFKILVMTQRQIPVAKLSVIPQCRQFLADVVDTLLLCQGNQCQTKTNSAPATLCIRECVTSHFFSANMLFLHDARNSPNREVDVPAEQAQVAQQKVD